IERPAPVREIALDLLARWDQGRDPEALREYLEMLERHADDAHLYQQVVPELDADTVSVAFARFPADMRRVLENYDEYMSYSLDFDYCDILADFYRRAYSATDDLAIRKLILTRLLAVGRSHNRYYVGDVVAGLLARARETSEVMMVVDVLTTHSDDAAWFAPNPRLREAELAPPVDEAIYGRE
ncbi:MAG: hypothetical protein M3401_08340, partial [Actinomycetota bacterium]|nr:hypothetical protein [Actinomycetota bacterium]